MILQKIILDNIRVHEHLEFEPALTGITAISGENGTGKSTIVDSFAWCLFGTKVRGTTNRQLIREGASPKTDTVQVQVFMIVGQHEYKVVRKIMNDSGSCSCEIYSRPINTNQQWKLECGPAVTHCEQFIRTLLGTTEKGFLTSTFIQQKQVDNILSTSGRERGQIIEKLVGLSDISEAIKLAKEESKSLQKVADVIQPGDLEEEKAKVENQREIAEGYLREKQRLEQVVIEDKKKYEEYLDTYQTEQIKQTTFDELTKKAELHKNTIKANKESLQNNLEMYQELKTSTDGKVCIDLPTAESELNDMTVERSNFAYNERKVGDRIDSIKTLLKSIVEPNRRQIRGTVEQELSEISESIEKVGNSIATNKYRIETLTNSMNVLNEENSDNLCPVCGTELDEAHREELIKEYEEEIKGLKTENKELNKKQKELKSDKTDLEDKIAKLDEEIKLADEQEKAKVELVELEKEYKSITKKLKDLDGKIKIKTKEVDDAKAVSQSANIIKQIKSHIEELEKDITNRENELTELNKEIENLSVVSKREFNKMTSTLNDLYNTSIIHDKDLTMVTEKLNDSIELGKQLLASYEKCRKATDKYKDIMKDLTATNYVTSVLTDFKEARGKYSIPSLTVLASEILSKFTNGKFTRVILSETFDATVETEEGTIRPVDSLSGGEVSAVAIALRLAISLFLRDNQPGLLILDEVLVSMSAERARLILEVAISVSHDTQTIFIAHNDDIHSIADKVVSL